ncbi:MAG: hypothetical protein K2P48_02510 [Lachnospiraceae bacterium]|nr:hypothetical protein [Lachnospiraceae bacterium]
MEDNNLYPEQKEELTTAGEESAGQKEEQDALSAASGAGQEESVPDVRFGEQPDRGGACPDNGYPNRAYYDNGRSTDWQNASYYNGAFSGTGGQNYEGGYQQYNGAQPYQNTYQNTYQNAYQNPYQNNSQMELEEPVKISEWVLAMVLMMIPCVNIIMMFVWAFSSTEKKSKSNFFKAYLIFFGISMGVMLFVWIAIVFAAMLAY